MARVSIDITTILKKIEPKTGILRRTLTGNSSIKIKEPNYLRVSTGSCHDICKYNVKRAFPVKPWRPVGRILDKNVSVSLDNNHRGMKAIITSPKVMPSVSSRQHHSELSKPKACKTDAFSRKSALLKSPNKVISVSSRKPKTSKTGTFSHQPAPKQPIRTLLTGSSRDKRESQNDAGNKVKKPRLSYRKLPTAKSKTGNNISLRKNDSQPEIMNNTCNSGNVPEKAIHVIEPEDESRNKSPVQESRNSTGFTTPISLNQESSSNNRKKTTEGAARVMMIIPEEKNYSTPKKMKFKRGKVLPMVENGINAVDRSFKRPVSEGKVNHKKNDSIGGGVLRHQSVVWKNRDSVLLNIVIEERASNLVRMMRKTKVEALVGAFESVISKTQDS